MASVQLFDEFDDSMIDETITPPGGGPYSFGKLRDGIYRIEAYATGYSRKRAPGLAISGGSALTGIDIILARAGKITGSVSFADGPGAAVTVAAHELFNDAIGGEGAIELPAGGPFELLVPEGTWRIRAAAQGYVPETLSATIVGSDSVHVGEMLLSAVRGTRIVLIDDDGTEIESVNTTVSFPDSGIWFYAAATVEARDEAGRRDRYDVEGHFAQVGLRATKLNNVTPPRGTVVFADPADTTVIDSIALSGGRGSFLISDDEIEVLRIFAETATGGISGRFKAGIRSAEPEYFEITAAGDRIVADGEQEVAISGRLLDVSGNPVRIAGVPIGFLLAPSSTGAGQFTVPSTVTTADGEAFTALTATGAGELHATASVTYMNRELVILGTDDLGYLPVTAVAGPPAGVELSIPADVVGFGEGLEIGAQLVDAFGNAVAQDGYTLTFSSTPAGAGTLAPVSAPLDTDGSASTVFTAAAGRNIVQVSAVCSPALPVEGIAFIIDEIQTISDPPFPEPDLSRQSLEAMDLTKVIVSNTADALELRIRFTTNWDGAHLVVLMETRGDAAGAVNDPFLFPVSYAHPLLPDYCFTWKYSSDDYADMRRWSGTEWEWWDDGNGAYISTSSGTWVEGINVQGDWTAKDGEWATITVPFDFLEGAVPQTMRLQVYLTQETDVKRAAFDSAPHDSTLNLDFDPDDPSVDWSVALTPVTLRHYADPYTVLGDFPSAPALGELLATPDIVDAGGTVLFTARVIDAGDGIGAVLVDLSPVGGSRYQFMYNDGTGGDETAGDGVYSILYIVDPGVAGGEYALAVSARDSRNISASQGTLTFTVQGTAEPIRVLTDEEGDDHGPNLFGREGLYYLYPTNQVFLQRSFDLEEMTIFETSKIVAGEIIPSIAFEVKIGRHPDPADEGTADWNPFYAGINIQKIDIMIDAFKGGATEGLPNRQNDFSRWDAWDYAIVMEGWYKGVLTSGNQNTSSAWSNSVRKSDRDIILISDYEKNTITGVVSKEALGNPTAEEIRSWDVMVVMTSHDGNSDDNNFGDTRWVNASPSEWNFGGGGDLDRDPNIIDLMIGPGTGRTAGRTQAEMLNYKTDEAVARLNDGITACYLEMTTFEDQGPPVITVGVPVDETIPFTPLVNAPLYFTALVTDDDEVREAVFRWRADSVAADTWMGELEMGYAGGDIWSVDLPIEDMLENVIIAPYDSTWNIEFQIEAADPSGNTAITSLYTMEISRPVPTFVAGPIDMASDFEVRAPEGTLARIPSDALTAEAREVPYRFELTSEYAGDFPAIPPGARSVNVIRTLEFKAIFRVPGDWGDSVDVYVPLPEFERPVPISFHYPQYSVGGLDENLIGVYELNRTTGVWIYIGGTVNPFGNLVTAEIARPGTYALLHNPEFSYTPGEVFSGVVFSPNPFSPNGDGLYEETSISFYLSAEATVTIEIYDMDGYRRRILERRIAITAEDTPDARPRRVTGFTWDGRDNTGAIVPYGIYVCRFTVTYQQAAGQRTIRHNAAVAVIK
ncbi:MAG: glucodextranase DOMON-like domain-containing protein [Candidatus Krumholzibacteria bacterium]|nr:glucodextranase DOMON-like domain-containing protein [Candidatus Krumholzibacteria bacterium]